MEVQPEKRPSLDDRYALDEGRQFLTGNQALIRMLIEQMRADRTAGLRTRAFVTGYPGSPLGSIDLALQQAKKHLDVNIATDITDMDGLKAFFADSVEKPGWVLAQWSKPSGADLDKVEAQLKALKLTLRNTPRDSEPADGPCIFTGAPAVERVLIARAY
jgi:hypothetical protein